MFELSVEEIITAIKPEQIINACNLPNRLKGISLDTRTIKKQEAFLALKGGNYDAHNFLKYACDKGSMLLIAERIPGKIIEGSKTAALIVKDTVSALGQIGRSLREKFSGQVIAVTGSLGKTTAKDMTWTGGRYPSN